MDYYANFHLYFPQMENDTLVSDRTGIPSGLKLRIAVEQDEYIYTDNFRSAGVKVNAKA